MKLLTHIFILHKHGSRAEPSSPQSFYPEYAIQTEYRRIQAKLAADNRKLLAITIACGIGGVVSFALTVGSALYL